MQRSLLFLLATLTLTSVQAAEVPARKPAILFSCPGENRYMYAGFDYLRELTRQGFEVDYCEGAKELTWDRVKNFNVLVVLDFPAAKAGPITGTLFGPGDDGQLDAYWGVIEKFRKAGGGVLIHYSPSYGGGAPNPLLGTWGLQFPLIWLTDSRVEKFTNMEQVSCALTDQILPSPVSDGVTRIWYPVGVHYTASHTMPIVIDANWQAVVRAGKTARTEVPVFSRSDEHPAPGALIPAEPIRNPVLFAIREWPKEGRAAAIQTWHTFSIGSGMKWFYSNEILSRGLMGQPSDYGKLLVNTYRWLAAASAVRLGGYVTDPNRLLDPQLRPGALDKFHEWHRQDDVLHRPPADGKLYRGLIGAQTALSGGTGSVAEYAQAAAAAQLDYVVFLEDFTQMTAEKFAQLKAAVKQHSTPTLRLFAGYRIQSNTGNYLYVYGMNPVWPEPRMLTGEKQQLLNVQYQDEQGKFAQGGTALFWFLGQGTDAAQSTVGYYKFSQSPQGMRMSDLRAYSQAAVRTYADGKLVEDVTADYLTTAQCTLAPTPVSVNLVKSPQALTDAVAKNQSLTYGVAASLERLWADALHWNDIFTGMNVFVSDGPRILVWPRVNRVMTFGAEWFVTERSLNPATIHVTSAVGLKEIRIYDGQALFRRLACGGSKDFQTRLELPAVINQNLVLVAEDVNGGRAVSAALRHYKEGSKYPAFCGDHVNDCGGMLLAHGPHWASLFFTPIVPDAGGTWDGGPAPTKALLSPQFTYPEIVTTPPEYFGAPPYQTPLLEFADEGATRNRMVCDRQFVEAVRQVPVNPWNGYGPIEPTTLADAWASHTYFDQPIPRVEGVAWGGIGVKEGPIASLFTQHIQFKKSVMLNRLGLFHGWWREKNIGRTVLIAHGRGGQVANVIDATDLPQARETFRVETGDWLAFFSGQPANTHLLINRGAPVICALNPPGDMWFRMSADMENVTVQPGATLDTEFFAIVWPMSDRFVSARSVADVVAYLEKPTRLELKRGKQAAAKGGLLELEPVDYAVELSIPKTTLPVIVPLRVNGFNKRWSVGLYQLDGHRTHYYSPANTGYRALGLDFDGRAYVPFYVHLANAHVQLGHPIVADQAGQDLFIQVTKVRDNPDQWYVAVNNPTDAPITAKLTRAMDLPGLKFVTQDVTLRPGEYRLLE